MRKLTKIIAPITFSFFVLLSVGTVCLTGCKPSSAQLASRQEKINREVEKICADIQDFEAKGQFSDAVSLIDKSLQNKRYAAHKGHLFSLKIDLFLFQNDDTKAGDLEIATWQSNPALARSVFGRLYNYYQQQANYTAIQKWCKRLLALGSTLPYDLKIQVFTWQLSTAISQKNPAAIEAGIDETIAALKPEDGAPLLQQALTGLVEAGQHAIVSSLANHIANTKSISPLYRNLAVTLSLRCVLAAKDWEKFPSSFQNCITQLPDDQLLKLMRMAVTVLQKNNQTALLDQSSKDVILHAIEKTNSVNFAARIWVETGVSIDKKLLPERLAALLNAKVSPIQVGNLFDRYFYEMVNDLDIIRQLCALGDRILSVCKDQTTIDNVKVKVLDGAFIVNDFDLAVSMLEQGIPGKDKAWHDMSLPKVKAHRALAQKKPLEAVKYFREFMNAWITSKQEEEYDPTTGIGYSREWILGRNAIRIAGILDSVPDKAEADKARAEAKAYFKVALEKAKNDTDALKLLKEETKDLGL